VISNQLTKKALVALWRRLAWWVAPRVPLPEEVRMRPPDDPYGEPRDPWTRWLLVATLITLLGLLAGLVWELLQR